MSNIIGSLFTIFTALILPIAAGIIIAVKKKAWKAVLLGLACFLIFQMFTRIPLLQYVLPQSADFVLFQSANPILYMALLALSAGIFEELGRYIMMRLFMKNGRYADSLAFGIGHGGIEAVLLVGINMAAMLFVYGGNPPGIPSADLLLSGVERLFAMLAHIGWSVMVWRGISLKKVWLIALAVLLHGLFDFVAVYLSYIGVGIYIIEAVIGLFAIILLAYTVYIGRKDKIEKELLQ